MRRDSWAARDSFWLMLGGSHIALHSHPTTLTDPTILTPHYTPYRPLSLPTTLTLHQTLPTTLSLRPHSHQTTLTQPHSPSATRAPFHTRTLPLPHAHTHTHKHKHTHTHTQSSIHNTQTKLHTHVMYWVSVS